MEHYLTQRRKEIERKYDYRYSQLTQVFGRLLHESRLSEEELRYLGCKQNLEHPVNDQVHHRPVRLAHLDLIQL